MGDALGYLHVNAAVLMSDVFRFLPREKVALAIIETMKAAPEILDRIRVLVEQSFRFALDDVIADSGDVRRLLPFADIIKLGLRAIPLSALPLGRSQLMSSDPPHDRRFACGCAIHCMRRADPRPAPHIGKHQERLGASHRSSSPLSTPRLAAMSLSWSSPTLPTTKYFDCGCAK